MVFSQNSIKNKKKMLPNGVIYCYLYYRLQLHRHKNT